MQVNEATNKLKKPKQSYERTSLVSIFPWSETRLESADSTRLSFGCLENVSLVHGWNKQHILMVNMMPKKKKVRDFHNKSTPECARHQCAGILRWAVAFTSVWTCDVIREQSHSPNRRNVTFQRLRPHRGAFSLVCLLWLFLLCCCCWFNVLCAELRCGPISWKMEKVHDKKSDRAVKWWRRDIF